MLARASSVGHGDRSQLFQFPPLNKVYPSPRRSKSVSSLAAVESALATGSEELLLLDIQRQARAAATHAYKNDIKRRQGFTRRSQPEGRNGVRFEASPPYDPEYNRDAYLDDAFTANPNSGRHHDSEKTDCFLGETAYISSLYSQEYAVPSSYRRIRRSRSVFAIQHHKPEVYSSVLPERSNSIGLPALRPYRSMSFLRGGTEFIPRSLREQRPVTKRRAFYFPTTFRESSGIGASSGVGAPSKYNTIESCGSFRKKIRKISESILHGVKRVFSSDKGGTIPAQHVQSTRSYAAVTAQSSLPCKENSVSFQNSDIYLSRVCSGVPSLQQVSSGRYPSQAGSIRIVTPPAPISTPLSSTTSGNTWATATNTDSTWVSKNAAARLSIIQESTPKKAKGIIPGDREQNRQRVYSAYMRIARRNAEAERTQKNTERASGSRLVHTASVRSRPSFTNTLRHSQTVQENRTIREGNKFTSSSVLSLAEKKPYSNESVTVQENSASVVTATHVTIGPRIVLYPLADQQTSQTSSRTTSGLLPTLQESRGNYQNAEAEGNRSKHIAVRQVQSAATFFPSTPEVAIRKTPSPYKRAKLMSLSVHSQSTSRKASPQQLEASLRRERPREKNKNQVERTDIVSQELSSQMTGFNIQVAKPMLGSRGLKTVHLSPQNNENTSCVSHRGSVYVATYNSGSKQDGPGEDMAQGLLRKTISSETEMGNHPIEENSPHSSPTVNRRRNRVLRSKAPQEVLQVVVNDTISRSESASALEAVHRSSLSKVMGFGRRSDRQTGRKSSIKQAVENQFGATVNSENIRPATVARRRQTPYITNAGNGALPEARSRDSFEQSNHIEWPNAHDVRQNQTPASTQSWQEQEKRVISARSVESDGAVFL